MFGGAFSLNKFSLRREIEFDVQIRVFFIEHVDSLISLGENTFVEDNYRENIRNNIIGTRGFVLSGTFNENISGEASAGCNFDFGEINLREDMNAHVFLSSNIAAVHDFKETIRENVNLVKNYALVAQFTENILGNIYLGKNTPIAVNFREAAFASINIEILDINTAVFTVSIPPGGELIINSENFTVTLNSQNIIDQHSGDWINLSRDVLTMAINSGGTLDGKLLYTERYL